jgi:hypothetical protein
MTTDRKKPGVAFWAIVVLVMVLAGYPLSFGPACRWSAQVGQMMIYRPCVYLTTKGPTFVRTSMRWWVELCAGERGLMLIDFEEMNRALGFPNLHESGGT